jgi:hypothetical protein
MLSFASEAPELQALKVRASSASVIGKYEIAILRTLGFAPLEIPCGAGSIVVLIRRCLTM